MMSDLWVNIGLYLMYILLGLCTLAVIVAAIVGMARNPRGSVMSLVSIAVLIVILGIGWAMASGEVPVKYEEVYSSGLWRWIDASLIAMYILLVGAFVLLIVMELFTAFK